MLPKFASALWALFLLVSVAQAQFNFFEHMFGGNQQQQQQHQDSQNMPSDSGRYQNMWRQGEFWNILLREVPVLLTPDSIDSSMQQLPLPRNSRLRTLPAPLPLRAP